MDPDSSTYLSALLILMQFGFIAGTSAITQLSDSQLKKDARENKTWGAIWELTRHPNKLMLGSEVFQSVTTIMLALSLMAMPVFEYARDWLTLKLGPIAMPLAFLLLAVIAVLIALPIARLLPRRLAIKNPEKLSYSLFPFVYFCLALVYPITALTGVLGSLFIRLFGIDPGHLPDQVTEEEIRMMVDAGEETGVIQQSEKDMINNIFEFDDRSADEVMTHRMDLIAVELNAPLEEILEAAGEGYSRIPVYREDIDNIVGILYVKDLLPLITMGRGDFSAEKIMRRPMFVPESTRCSELFAEFTTHKIQLAVVIDEYGGTSGIVTMEDLLESIVGNIQDEYDREEIQSSQLSEKIFTLDGSMGLDEVEHLLDITLPEDSDDYDTIGGLMVGLLDGIPTEGEHPAVEISGVNFTSIESDERRIIKIKAEKL